MGITEDLLNKKREETKRQKEMAFYGEMGITKQLLARRKAGLSAIPSPAESVGASLSEGILGQNNAKRMANTIYQRAMENRRENAVSPTQALEQMRGYTFSPAPSITLPTAQEMDAYDLKQTLKIADQKKAELDQQIAEQKAVQQKNNAGAAPAYAAISGTQQLRPAQISAPKSAAVGQNVKPDERTEQEKAFEQASQRIWELEREKDALSYIQDNAGKTYDDNFIGQFGASYTLGRLTQDESLAWNKYLDNPTEENRAYAEAIGQVISAFQLENQEVLADDATLPWVSQSLANYLPQFVDQVKYGAVGAVSGGTVGSVIPVIGTAAGIKAGITAASGVYSYQTMRGAAFKTLLDLGVPEDVARAAANDEAVISSAIEMADTGIDLLTLGGKELIAAMTGGAAKTAAKKGAESAVKKFLKALGKYGLNVAGEWTEEATQQAVSIANAKRVETGDMNGIFDLAGDAAKVFGKALWDKEDKNRAEILEAGEQGAIVAGLMGPLQAGFNQLAYTGVTALDNKASADYGQQLRSKGLESVTIEAGLKFDEGSRIRQMAEALQQKQQNGQEVTDVELGDLYRQIKIGARQEYQNAVQQAQNETAVQQQEGSGIMLPTADEMDAMLGVGSAESSLRQSGMEAGATEQAIESAERISTALGRGIQFFRQEAGERGTVNGFFDPNNGTIYVNSQSQNPVAQIIAHELTHSVEMADSYQELQSVVLDQLQKNGIDINRRRQEIQELYKRNNVELKDQAEIDQEIVAQFVETRLLTDEQTILDLTRTNRSLMERVLDWINRTLQKLGVRKTTERDTLEKARDLYARALQESREQEQNAAAAQQQKEVQDVVQYLRNALTSGEITESEYDEAMESVMEQASLAGVNLLDDRQYSISESFEDEIEQWNGEGNKTFHVGTTSEVLQSIGIEPRRIIWRGDKISKILNKHQYMTKETIKQVPNILENPIAILKSKKMESRIVLFGDVVDGNGKPVTAILELQPTTKGGELLRLNIIASAYGKDNTKSLIQSSDLLYLDPNKNRTDTWLQGLGLQLPSNATTYGSIGSITYQDGEVKIVGVPYMETVLEEESLLGVSSLEGKEYSRYSISDGKERRNAETALEHFGETEKWEETGYLTVDGRRLDFSGRHWGGDGGYREVDHRDISEALGDAYGGEDYSGALIRFMAEGNIRVSPESNGVDLSVRPTDAQEKALRDYFDWANGSVTLDISSTEGTTITSVEYPEGTSADRIIKDIRRYFNSGEKPRVSETQKFRYSISETYAKEIENWDAEGRRNGKVFILGATGDVLQGLGAMEQDIYLRSEKVNKILQEHQEMTLEEIKRIPEVLDDPVLVLKSQGAGARTENTRLVLFGTLRAKNGQPVLAVLDLRPIENMLAIDDMQKVNSAYTKDRGAANFVQRSEVLYADEKRTTPLLRLIGLTIASRRLLRSGSVGSIAYSNGTVNLHGIPLADVVQIENSSKDGGQLRYSIVDDQEPIETGITLPTADSESQLLRDQLPVKAKTYLQRAERAMVEQIGQSLSIPYRARRDILTGAVREMSEEYLSTGKISENTRRSLFEEAYEAGIVQDREFLDQYQGLRDYLRDTTLRISKEDSADIPDFNDYRRRNFGRLNISTQGGTNIDQVYKELSEIWPELFNEQRESTPSDQLNRISEVVKNFQVTERSLDEYYGEDAEEFKRYAYHDFSAAIDEQLHELQAVRRYQEQNQRQQSMEEQKPKTIEEVVQLWDQFKTEKRNYEKIAAKNLLTDEDERLVGQLLRGEITEQALDSETNNVKGILAVYESKKEFDRIAKQLRAWNADRKNKLKELADKYLETANGWKDKKAGILYSRETMERNIRDIVPDEALAQRIIDEYFTPVHKATAAATRMKNNYRQRVNGMNLSRDIAKGNIVSEAHAVQLLGEAEDNIRMLEKAKWTKERDGKTIEEWRKVVSDLWKENPNLDQKKIRDAVDSFRKIYDELFQQMNEVRVRNGYEPINYRSGYFPHFQTGDGDGILAAFGRAMGISTDVTALPTAINGLTHTFRPGIQWFGNAQERLGFNTAYDAVEGFDKYIEGVADVIYQTDNIQKLRQLANQVRYRTTDEEIRKQVNAVLASDKPEQDKQREIEDIYKNARFTLSNFVVALEEYTNLLANKKSMYDRTLESDIGRWWYNFAKRMVSKVGANMVAINPTSWVTNLIPLAQATAGIHTADILRGMRDTISGMNKQDGIVERSTFLTNRRGSDPVVKAWQQTKKPSKIAPKAVKTIGELLGKAGDKLSSPMEIIDNFTSESLIRARYAQNLRKGLSEQNAMDEADAWVAGLMADRSKGAMPTLFQRQGPVWKAITQYQLEPNNQLSFLLKDMPRELHGAAAVVIIWSIIKFSIAAFVYDELYEFLFGRRPALDPLDMLLGTAGDLNGWEVPNLIEWATNKARGEETEIRKEPKGLYEASQNLIESVIDQTPFAPVPLALIGGDIDGGRLPIANAWPDMGKLLNAALNNEMAGSKRLEILKDELGGTIGTYILPPFGGGLGKKAVQTISGAMQGGRYKLNNEGERQLQYPIYSDEPKEAIWNVIYGSIAGPTALPTGREWIESGFKSLSVKETTAYNEMKKVGTDDEYAYETIQAYKAAETNQEKRDIIRNADMPGEAKAVMYYQLMASDNEKVQMDLLRDAGEDMGKVVEQYLDIRDQNEAARAEAEAENNTEKSRKEMLEILGEAGLGIEDATVAEMEKDTIWANRSLNETEKRAEFVRWLNETDYSDEEREAIRDAILSEGSGTTNRYENLINRGIDDDIAYAIASDISRLEPLEGEESVSREQKRTVVFDRLADPEQQIKALETVNLESQQQKFVLAYENGVLPEVYAAVVAELPSFDEDGNGSLNQEEVKNALNKMGRGAFTLPGGTNDFTLSRQDKAVIWQLYNRSWKNTSNPFGTGVGKRIYDALNPERE